MKKILSTLKITAALLILIIFNDSVLSQNVISSVNANNSAKLMSKQITNNTSGTIHMVEKSENWMSNKNYLDVNSSGFSFYKMMAINEKVYENNKEIEDWMLDESEWLISYPIEEEVIENHRPIEEWMFDNEFWQIKIEDEKVPIEDWMLNDKFWVTVN